jgi:hypothetical protein
MKNMMQISVDVPSILDVNLQCIRGMSTTNRPPFGKSAAKVGRVGVKRTNPAGRRLLSWGKSRKKKRTPNTLARRKP